MDETTFFDKFAFTIRVSHFISIGFDDYTYVDFDDPESYAFKLLSEEFPELSEPWVLKEICEKYAQWRNQNPAESKYLNPAQYIAAAIVAKM